MNSRILLAVITIAVLSSCSTAYKAQTPDDVYYSPPKEQDSYVRTETGKDRNQYRAEEDDYADDRWLRWRVRNRMRWSNFDDYDWYDYRYANNWSYTNWNRNNYWSYWSWNRSYNPYCGKVIVVSPKNPVVYNHVRNYTPGTYKTPVYNNSNSARTKTNTSPGVYRPAGSYNNSNSGSLGNTIKKVFNNSNNNSSSNSSGSESRPARTYTPSTNNSSGSSSGSSSGGSSGGSGGGGVTRPGRGG